MNSMRSDVATGGQADPGKLQWLMTSTLWLKEGQSGLTDLGKNTWFKGKLPVLEPCCTMDHHRQFSPSPINMHDLHDRKSTSPALPGKGQGCHEASHWETDIEPPFKKFESQDHIFFFKVRYSGHSNICYTDRTPPVVPIKLWEDVRNWGQGSPPGLQPPRRLWGRARQTFQLSSLNKFLLKLRWLPMGWQ